MKNTIILILLLLSAGLKAQQADSLGIIYLNQQIDDHVVRRNVAALDTLYVEDFVFSHGSGRVEGKAGWLKTVARAQYPLRRHDSVIVEMHPGLAIVRGKLSIQRIDKDKTAKYLLYYIRIYALRSHRWKMLSPYTFYEWHEG